MSSWQPKRNSTLRQRKFVFAMGCFSFLFISPFLLYYCYCWAWWARQNLLLQYLFQCSCPVVSEEARYPEQADVIISACRRVAIMPSPNGDRLYVLENHGLRSSYLLDLRTREKIPIGHKEGYFHFLTDNILYVWLFGGEGEFILDGETGLQYPITGFRQLQPDALINGYVDPDLLRIALFQADQIFLIDAASYPAVVLSSDFRNHPEHNFIIYNHDFPGPGVNKVEQFLQQNKMIYKLAPTRFPWKSLPEEVVSPDKRFIARSDGIYLVKNNQKIVEGVSFSVRGWMYNGRGVIYTSYRCLFRIGLPFADDTACFRSVHQPVLLLKVPEEYLSPTERP